MLRTRQLSRLLQPYFYIEQYHQRPYTYMQGIWYYYACILLIAVCPFWRTDIWCLLYIAFKLNAYDCIFLLSRPPPPPPPHTQWTLYFIYRVASCRPIWWRDGRSSRHICSVRRRRLNRTNRWLKWIVCYFINPSCAQRQEKYWFFFFFLLLFYLFIYLVKIVLSLRCLV